MPASKFRDSTPPLIPPWSHSALNQGILGYTFKDAMCSFYCLTYERAAAPEHSSPLPCGFYTVLAFSGRDHFEHEDIFNQFMSQNCGASQLSQDPGRVAIQNKSIIHSNEALVALLNLCTSLRMCSSVIYGNNNADFNSEEAENLFSGSCGGGILVCLTTRQLSSGQTGPPLSQGTDVPSGISHLYKDRQDQVKDVVPYNCGSERNPFPRIFSIATNARVQVRECDKKSFPDTKNSARSFDVVNYSGGDSWPSFLNANRRPFPPTNEVKNNSAVACVKVSGSQNLDHSFSGFQNVKQVSSGCVKQADHDPSIGLSFVKHAYPRIGLSQVGFRNDPSRYVMKILQNSFGEIRNKSDSCDQCKPRDAEWKLLERNRGTSRVAADKIHGGRLQARQDGCREEETEHGSTETSSDTLTFSEIITSSAMTNNCNATNNHLKEVREIRSGEKMSNFLEYDKTGFTCGSSGMRFTTTAKTPQIIPGAGNSGKIREVRDAANGNKGPCVHTGNRSKDVYRTYSTRIESFVMSNRNENQPGANVQEDNENEDDAHDKAWAEGDDSESELDDTRDVNMDMQTITGIEWVDSFLVVWHAGFLIISLVLLAVGVALRVFFSTLVEHNVKSSANFLLYSQFVRVEHMPPTLSFGDLTNVLGESLIVTSILYIGCMLMYMTFLLHKIPFTLPLVIIVSNGVVLSEVNIINIYMSPESAANEEAKTKLKAQAINEYAVNSPSPFSVTYDIISIWGKCCGIVDQYDFQNSVLKYSLPTRKEHRTLQVPPLCCKPEYFKLGVEDVIDCATKAEGIYTDGCYSVLYKRLRFFCNLFSIVVVLQLLDVLIHILLYKKHLRLLEIAI